MLELHPAEHRVLSAFASSVTAMPSSRRYSLMRAVVRMERRIRVWPSTANRNALALLLAAILHAQFFYCDSVAFRSVTVNDAPFTIHNLARSTLFAERVSLMYHSTEFAYNAEAQALCLALSQQYIDGVPFMHCSVESVDGVTVSVNFIRFFFTVLPSPRSWLFVLVGVLLHLYVPFVCYAASWWHQLYIYHELPCMIQQLHAARTWAEIQRIQQSHATALPLSQNLRQHLHVFHDYFAHLELDCRATWRRLGFRSYSAVVATVLLRTLYVYVLLTFAPICWCVHYKHIAFVLTQDVHNIEEFSALIW